MRAIIIEEDRFTDLTDALRLKEQDKRSDGTAAILGCDSAIWRAALQHARGEMHYEFVRWAQSHGASCVRNF